MKYIFLTFVVNSLLHFSYTTEELSVRLEDDPSFYCNFDKNVICSPEQIRISLTDSSSEMMVTWSSTDLPANGSPLVYYSHDQNALSDGSASTVPGAVSEFIDTHNYENMRQYIIRGRLVNLTPVTTYYYQVESVNSRTNTTCLSGIHTFKTLKDGADWVPRILVLGDLGYENSVSFPSLEKETTADMYDVAVHLGDFAYNLHDHCGKQGDKWFNMVQPMTSHLPYMVTPGNHERKHDYKQYRGRFSMPGDSEGMYFSWNVGPIHFISINVDLYKRHNSMKQLKKQYEWLKKDLKEAQKNRAVRPWIIAYGHEPFYTTNAHPNQGTCTDQTSGARAGDIGHGEHYGPMEVLFMKYGVDICFWGHVHSYERLWPLYDYQVLNGTDPDPYKNPQAPVHIITGAAGNFENLTTFHEETCDWSAVRYNKYGYGRLRVENFTHLHWEQIDVQANNNIIDEFWVVQENHGPFSM